MSDTKEFLLEEYKSLTEAIRINEQTGEARLNFFYTVTSAVLGAIVFFLTKIRPVSVTGEINNKTIYDLAIVEIVILIFLIGLFFVGIIVQRRLRNRNLKTDSYIHDLEKIREIFKSQENISKLPADYLTFKPRNSKTRKRVFTSLVDISRVMNILILAIIITIGTFFIAGTVEVFVTIATIFVGIAIFYGKAIWLSLIEQPTHAGGVLFRKTPTGEVEFLVVKSSNDQEWVLPKGHIEHGETPRSAATREVMEETGFLGRPKNRLGLISYTYKTKRIKSAFFLMEISQPENRDKKWLRLEDASRVLHPQSAELLKGAVKVIEGI